MDNILINNIAPIVGFFASMFVFYGIVQGKMKNHDEDIKKHDDRILELEKNNSDIAGIKSDIKWIVDILKKKFKI